MNIGQLHLGAGHQAGPLTLFPVWAEGTATTGITTGAAANLEVSELASGPQVSRLTVTNRDTRTVLLLEGELLEGGHQHRVCARDTILAPNETRDVETYCVEKGRWSGATRHSRSARRAPLSVRTELHRPNRGADTQSRIWDRVDRYQGLNTRSATGSLLEHLDAGSRRTEREQTPLPAPIDGQRGFAIGYGGQALMLELFGSHELFLAHYRPAVEAAWLDLQLLTGKLPAVATRAQSARDLAVRLMRVDLPRDSHDFQGTSGPVAFRGITTRNSGPEAMLAHLSGWDVRHPLMAG
ncbi:ARPP-1 family domain-containing protein [Zafaria cholistanensis]|uniref:ARPP-1 family domain-containing protein n=1 Tax=Zafaria cholistanensis TaxID=1682741 RepID=UPI0012314261|nr:DUF6569 family protein [Zafaria cholistanensis]